MRVLYLSPFSQQVSGPDESLLVLLHELVSRGVQASLVLPAPGPHVERYRALGVKVRFAPITLLKRRPTAVEAATFAPRLARGVAAVAAIARSERADLIHTNMEVVLDGALASRLLRLPHVLHYRGNTLDEPKWVFDALVRFWTATAEKIFCISRGTAAIFERRGRAVRVQPLYNPVNVDAFAHAERSATVRRQLGAEEGELLVGSVCRLHPRKDLETFVRAGAMVAARVPATRLVVVGAAEGAEEETYRARLERLARELGVAHRLLFTGPRRDMPRVLKALDVLVLSSRNEGFGRVVAEAMAAGVPQVVTREGALPELVEDGRLGLLAAPGDAAEFADQITRLLGDDALRRRLAEAAFLKSTVFAAPSIAEEVMRVYQSLLGGDAVAAAGQAPA